MRQYTRDEDLPVMTIVVRVSEPEEFKRIVAAYKCGRPFFGCTIERIIDGVPADDSFDSPEIECVNLAEIEDDRETGHEPFSREDVRERYE